MSNIKTLTTLAKKIKRARQASGLSQKELGKVLKLSDKAISSYEVGRAQPSVETLVDLGKVTHKPVSYFFEQIPEEDLDLQLKIKKIEQELLEIKRIVSRK